MATATYTCTVFNASPKFLHEGTVSLRGQVAWTATSTVGDIAFLAKVPHTAKILDFGEYHTTGAATQALSFGFGSGIAAGGGANLSCLIASGAQATMNRFSFANSPNTGNGPLQISVSDLDPNRYAVLQAKIESGTTTTSLFANWFITYYMDGPDPV